MKRIELSKYGKKNKGKYFAIVDDADYEWLIKYNWYFNFKYAAAHSKSINGKQKTIYLHRLIMKTPKAWILIILTEINLIIEGLIYEFVQDLKIELIAENKKIINPVIKVFIGIKNVINGVLGFLSKRRKYT